MPVTSLQIVPRRNLKTTSLTNLAIKQKKKDKKVLFIAMNSKMVNSIQDTIFYATIEFKYRVQVINGRSLDINMISSSILKSDLIIMDEFLSYNRDIHDLVSQIRHINPNIDIIGLGSPLQSDDETFYKIEKETKYPELVAIKLKDDKRLKETYPEIMGTMTDINFDNMYIAEKRGANIIIKLPKNRRIAVFDFMIEEIYSEEETSKKFPMLLL